MVQEYDDLALYTQLKYYETLFDVPRALTKRQISGDEIQKDREIFEYLKQYMMHTINASAYNWIRPSLWEQLFKQIV
jgi:DNA polymerase alpha subunit A